MFPTEMGQSLAESGDPCRGGSISHAGPSNLDWSTFQWTGFGFGDNVISIPAGTQHYQTTLPMTYNGVTFRVVVTLDLDPLTGMVTASFQSLNAANLMTGPADCPGTLPLGPLNPFAELPPDVTVGFLPPEDGTGRGMGYLTYTVKAKPGLSTGTQIRNVADVTFDLGKTIATDQVSETDPTQGVDPNKEALVTIDSAAPNSTVAVLPAVSTTTAFTVSWSGTDDTGGSGIASYTIYVSDNGGPYTPWLTDTTLTSAPFVGQDGHTYHFYSVATDNVGNQERPPTSAQAMTTVDANPPTSTVAALPQFSPGTFTVSWSGNGSNAIASYTIYVSDNGGAFTPWLTDTTQTSATYTGLNGHTYGFYSIATDILGDPQPTPATAQATTTVDTVAPTSTVSALPAVSPDTFTLSWSGSDNPGGSGLASYDVFVSDDGGLFMAMLTDTTETSVTFAGEPGHTYGFFSVAVDNVGNVQPASAVAQATTLVQGATTTQVSSDSPYGSVYGQAVTFTVTVLGVPAGTPTGTVQFLLDGANYGAPVSLAGGVARVTVSGLSVGNHTVGAIYTSDSGAFADSTAPDLTAAVAQAGTTAVLAESVTGSVYSQPVTLTATVSPVAPGAGTPTGMVTFTDGAATLGMAPLAGGVATLTVPALAAGTHQLRAGYAGDGNFAGGSTGSVTQVVVKDTTTTSLAASTATQVYDQFVTFTATVTADAPGAGGPTGSVTFYDGTTELAGAAVVNGVATFKTQALAVGGHAIAARYNGAAGYVGSGPTPAVPVTVGRNAAAVAVVSSAAQPVYGQPVTYTISVAAAPVDGAVYGRPTGAVDIAVDGVTVAIGVPLDATGRARYTTAALAPGSHTVTATYTGDAHFLDGYAGPGGTGSVAQAVNKARAAAVVTSSLNPAVVGQPVTLTATVSVVAPGAGTPTGAVVFTVDGVALAPTPLSGGTATLQLSALGAGKHSVSVQYAGDGDFTAATSGTLAETVAKAGTTTTLSLDSGGGPTVAGQVVTLTATVAIVAPGSAPLTGTVTFRDGTGVLGTVPLSGGVATLTTAGLKVGTHTLTATYNGDPNTASSTSAGATQAVNPAGTTTTLATSLSPAYAGQAVKVTATVAPVAPGGGVPTGTVQFYIDGAVYGGALSVVNGVATLTLPRLAAGDHVIAATYTGTANYLTSTAAPLTQTILPARADLAVAMSADQASVSVGGLVTYTITVTNAGPSATAGYVLSLPVPGGAAYVSGAASFGTVTLSGGKVIGHAYLAAGGSITYTIVLRATAVGTLTTTATLTAPEADPDLSNNAASWTVTVTP